MANILKEVFGNYQDIFFKNTCKYEVLKETLNSL